MLRTVTRAGSLLFAIFLTACAATPAQPPCPGGRQDLPDCPPQEAVRDMVVESHYQRRTRASQSQDDLNSGLQVRMTRRNKWNKRFSVFS